MDGKAINLEAADNLQERKSSLPKYHEDGPFMDPVIRCNNCGEIDLTEKWRKRGYCKKCGNRRCRNVVNLTVDDRAKVIHWNVDSDFLALFEKVDDD